MSTTSKSNSSFTASTAAAETVATPLESETTSKVAEVAPMPISTETGTVKMASSELARSTVSSLSVGPLRLTVKVLV